jgi:hypothetical protein
MSDKKDTQPNSQFRHAGIAKDGWSTDKEATATCFCGAVQLAFVRPFVFERAALGGRAVNQGKDAWPDS